MKITGIHLVKLHDAINDARENSPTLDEYAARELSAKRWRWDLFWRIPADTRHAFTEALDADLGPRDWNDDHLDTALRRVTDTR